MDSEERILIVDDDESSRRTLKLIFNKKNYNIETVGSGKEAIEKIKDKSFNIVFLDIKLPDMEGVELIKPLKELHPDIVVIMVTAYASMETAVRALNEGASAYIHKPLNIDEVLKTVDDVFEKQRLIKEKRQAEEALRASETKYRNVVEHSLQGFMILQDGRIILANKALARMSKYTRQELMDLSPEEVVNSIHPEDRAFVMENMQDHLQGNSVPKRSEHRRLRKDGIDYWVESFTELIEYEGRPTLQIALVDITDRKEAEEKIKAYTNNLEKIVEERTYELKLSESRYRGLYESSIDGIISMDMEERIVEYNQAFENMLGYPKRTVRRLNYRNLIPKKWHDKIAKIIKQQIFLRGYSDAFEIEFSKNDGTIFPVSVRMWLIKDEEDLPTGLWATIRDITQRKKLEQMRSDFINVAAHELRTPLSALKAHVDLLQMKLGFDLWSLPSEVIEKIEIIARNSNRLALLINNILDYTRLEAGTIKMNKELNSLDTLVAQVIQEIMPLVNKFNHELNFTTPKELPLIYIDKEMVYTIMSNVLSNAIKYTPNGGKINVSIIEEVEYLHLMVKDTGIGLSEEDAKKIFQPFHVADLAESSLFETKSEFERTGLGLAIANEYVSMHGGNIWAESILGQGSTFHVLLPKRSEENDSNG